MRKGPIWIGVGLLLAVAAVARGVNTRTRALAVVAQETRDQAVPAVAVIAPARGAPQQEIVLPGTVQALMDASIYARTNGYLKKWYADIGTHVRAGQLLAEIDTPEIDQQLQQARADLATAQANQRLALTTAERYRDLITSDSVARQDLDNANGNLEARETAVESARANVRRLEQLEAFRRIESPFDGVITARNTDIGALIDPGSSSKELFHVAAIQSVRVFVNVPQVYSRAARPGLTATLALKEFPDKQFTGRLTRTSNAIDTASGTLLIEIDVDNRGGELLPGAYAEVHIKLPTPTETLKLPVDALIFKGDGLQVATVDASSRVTLVSVTTGRDFGDAVEVVSGLQGHERVIAHPADSITAGQTVRVVTQPAGRSGQPGKPGQPGQR